MDEREKKVIADIEEYGCHIVHVIEEDDLPRFTYSVGIEKTTGSPDVIITGLKREVAHWVINEYKNRIRSGDSFIPGTFYDGFLESFDVTFIEVAKEYYQEYFGWGLWYNNGDSFKMLQLVYPSTSGVWPWDKDVAESFLLFQPLLKEQANN